MCEIILTNQYNSNVIISDEAKVEDKSAWTSSEDPPPPNKSFYLQVPVSVTV